MLSRLRDPRGFTLTELMIATTISVFVIMGIVRVDAGRAGMANKVRLATGLVDGQGDAARAMMEIGKIIEQADRINVVSFGPLADIQVRQLRRDPVFNCGTGCFPAAVPDPCCFDQPFNFKWYEIKVTGPELRRYDRVNIDGCANLKRLAGGPGTGGITNFTVAFAPNNVMTISMTWDNLEPAPGNRIHVFTDRVVARSISVGNLGTTANDSGTGLAPAGVSNPPALCP